MDIAVILVFAFFFKSNEEDLVFPKQAGCELFVGKFGLLAMALFLAILVVGFIYEWKKGALEWD